jgi:hypothetical protein
VQDAGMRHGHQISVGFGWHALPQGARGKSVSIKVKLKNPAPGPR